MYWIRKSKYSKRQGVFLMQCLWIFICGTIHSQDQVSGHIYTIQSSQPLAYANIGIESSSTGTISDHDGSFTLRIAESHKRDSVVFSALGYKPVKISVNDLLNSGQIQVHLTENIYDLSEIVVTDRRSRHRNIIAGNPFYEGGALYADTIQAGSAMALYIDNHNRKGKEKFEYPIYLEDASIMIYQNTFKSYKVRIRILQAIEKDGKPHPGTDLLQESLVIESTKFEGWLDFDLAKFQLAIEKDFFIAFEWILEKRDRVKLHQQYHRFRQKNPDKIARYKRNIDGQQIVYDDFQGNFYFGTSFGISVEHTAIRDHICFYRHNSFGTWYPSPTIVSAKVGLSYSARF